MTTLAIPAITDLKQRIVEDRQKHAKDIRIDSLLYNGGTVLILIFTATAAFLDPAWLGTTWAWLPRALAALAALLVGLERALSFGARWRFHRDLYSAYSYVLDKIDTMECGPDQEKDAHFKEILDALKVARSRESGIPTGEGTPNSTPTPTSKTDP